MRNNNCDYDDSQPRLLGSEHQHYDNDSDTNQRSESLGSEHYHYNSTMGAAGCSLEAVQVDLPSTPSKQTLEERAKQARKELARSFRKVMTAKPSKYI